MAVGVAVRSLEDADHGWKVDTLVAGWGSTEVARLGELIDAAALPGFVAVRDDGERVGLVIYAVRPDGCEVVALQALVEHVGVGRALMDAVRALAESVGALRLWLTTTNDNLRALGFYQRWGMDLVRLVRDGVEVSRIVKPTIPAVGAGGVPLRHELELELGLG